MPQLPQPPGLVALDSEEGEALFLGAGERGAFWPLVNRFESEDGLTFCSAASCVMVLNALAVAAPESNAHPGFREFTQENFFSPAVQAIYPRETMAHCGPTLEQFAAMLATYPVEVRVRHADDATLGEFRRDARAAVAGRRRFVISNFARSVLGQEGWAHNSPLGAYHEGRDLFLVLDVARFKYGPFWVPADRLFEAMLTVDPTAGRSRGYVTVGS
ncbi:MAG: phytochelatin synthase family protein [Candidatus Eremiobacterota bacterium]